MENLNFDKEITALSRHRSVTTISFPRGITIMPNSAQNSMPNNSQSDIFVIVTLEILNILSKSLRI